MALTQALIDDIDTAFDINGDKQNIEIRNAFQALLDSGVATGTKYKAMLNQSGTNAPTDIIAVDTLGGAWSYTGVGTYTYTKVGAFSDMDKVFITVGRNDEYQPANVALYAIGIDADSIQLTLEELPAFTGGLGTRVNDILWRQPIEIEILP